MNRWKILRASLCALMFLCCGCGRLRTEYGRSSGAVARVSLNGFTALRNAYEHAGFHTRDVSRLSHRVSNVNVLVWTPPLMTPIKSSVTRWTESWLSRGNRTLVYVIPDSGSEADYWIEAAKLARPDLRLEFRRHAGHAINQRMQWRLNREPVLSNGWFHGQPLVSRIPLEQWQGPWQDAMEQPNQDDPNSQERPRKSVGITPAIEYKLVPYDKDNPPKGVQWSGNGPTGPATQNWYFPVDATVSRTEIEFKTLLATDDQTTVVAEITSENWRQSRILVVAGGSLLTNFALTHPTNRRLAEQLIASSGAASETTQAEKTDMTVGFVWATPAAIPVSERQPGLPVPTGMELLKVWPLSMVTMHGIMLAVVTCLILVPIFGRPRRVRRAEPHSFGHHLDAVAALMTKVGGESYARHRISEYMKRVRGETAGPWILPDEAIDQTKAPSSNWAAKRRKHPATSKPTSRSTTSPSKSSPSKTSTAPAADNRSSRSDASGLPNPYADAPASKDTES